MERYGGLNQNDMAPQPPQLNEEAVVSEASAYQQLLGLPDEAVEQIAARIASRQQSAGGWCDEHGYRAAADWMLLQRAKFNTTTVELENSSGRLCIIADPNLPVGASQVSSHSGTLLVGSVNNSGQRTVKRVPVKRQTTARGGYGTGTNFYDSDRKKYVTPMGGSGFSPADDKVAETTVVLIGMKNSEYVKDTTSKYIWDKPPASPAGAASRQLLRFDEVAYRSGKDLNMAYLVLAGMPQLVAALTEITGVDVQSIIGHLKIYTDPNRPANEVKYRAAERVRDQLKNVLLSAAGPMADSSQADGRVNSDPPAESPGSVAVGKDKDQGRRWNPSRRQRGIIDGTHY